jgi:hypothetical protein
VPAKGRRVEAKLGGGNLDHAGDVARSKSLIGYALDPPIENAPEDRPATNAGCFEPSLKGCDGPCDLAPRNARLAAEPRSVSLRRIKTSAPSVRPSDVL